MHERLAKLLPVESKPLMYALLCFLCAQLELLWEGPAWVSVSGFCALYVVLFPGFFWGMCCLPVAHKNGERILLAAGSGFLGAVLATYLVAWLGRGCAGAFLLLLDFLVLGALWTVRHKREVFKVDAALSLPLLLLVLVAVYFRFSHLGNAEFQGDEARALHLAVKVAEGDGATLLAHKKGPVEVLFPAAAIMLTRHINEWSARLPFAVCGLLIILGAYFLAHSFFAGRRVGLLAALLLTAEGFLLGFSRIVQYQSPLVFFLICCWIVLWPLVNPECAEVRSRLMWAGLFFAAALLSHYDAILVLPALMLPFAVAFWKAKDRGLVFRSVIPALIVALLAVGMFYVPFFFHAQFAQTSQYLASRINPQGFPYNNVAAYLSLLSFYNSLYFVAACAAVLVGGLFVILYQRFGRGVRGFGVAVLAALLLVLCLAYPALLQLKSGSSIAFAVYLVLLILAQGGVALPLKALLLWFAAPFIAFSFFSYRPNTHFYVLHVAATLLCSYALVRLGEVLNVRPWVRWAPAVGVCAVTLLSFPYSYLLFLRQLPEYRFVYPRARSAWYWAPYGNKLPKGAFFGFPHRSGWKAVGALYLSGTLKGSYSSNEEELITSWYLRGQPRDDNAPQNVFLVRLPNDPVPVSLHLKEYSFFGRVYVDDQRCIAIYTKTPRAEPQRYDLSKFIDFFDQRQLL
jgi:hypothetical protein